MKKLLLLTGMTTLILSMSGCLSTLYPLFTEKDLVYDARLLGEWKENADDEESMVIEKASRQALSNLPALQPLVDKAYIISFKSMKTKVVINEQSLHWQIEQKFIAFLTKLDNGLYLDFFPTPTDRQKQYDDFYKQHFTGMHSFYRIQVHNDRSFEISQLKEEYLKDLIKQKRVRIKHEVYIDGSYVITAPTQEIQQYVLKYGSEPEAYDENILYTKIQSL